MGRKKKIYGETVEVDIPEPVIEPVKPVKQKREMSDAQRANLAKGFAILKAKREAKGKEKEAFDISPPPAPPPAPAPPSAPAPPPAPPPASAPVVDKPVRKVREKVVMNYLTKEEFHNSLMSLKQELISKPSTQPVSQHITQPVVASQKERVISGSELLNRLFFNQ